MNLQVRPFGISSALRTLRSLGMTCKVVEVFMTDLRGRISHDEIDILKEDKRLKFASVFFSQIHLTKAS